VRESCKDVFDIQVFPYSLIGEQEGSSLAGLFTSVPPRRAARGRENDQLILLLTLEGSASLPAEAQQEMLEKVAEVYYRTRGTVTHALKTLVEQLNERLVARTMRLQGKGLPLQGILNAVVVHGNAVYIAHAGPTYSSVLSGQTAAEYADTGGGNRGLGISKAVYVRYYRAEVQPGDLALLCPRPPAVWHSKYLAGSQQLSLDELRRKLLAGAQGDLRLVVLRFQRGKGEIKIAPLHPVEGLPAVLPEKAPAETGEPAGPPSSPPEMPVAGAPAARIEPAQPLPSSAVGTSPSPPVEEPPDFPPHLEVEETVPTVEPAPWSAEAAGASEPPGVDQAAAERLQRRRQVERRARRTVSTALKGGRRFRESLAAFLSRFLPRVLPGQADRLPALSPAVMVFIAIAVPLVIVAAASTAYIRSGRNEQHRAYLAQAQALIDQAVAQNDVTLRRVNMEAALDWVFKAEEYGTSPESSALKDQVQSALDALDGIRRLNLELALPGGFDSSVRITRIVSNQAEDLFLLDAASGRVFRLIYTRPGYEVDTQFVCGPGMLGGLIIGPLVDIVAAPPGNLFDAAVLGIDEFGNLLYCSVTATNTTAVTLPAPDAGWGKIKAISVDASGMLVLDTGANAVWRYEGFAAEYPNPPRFFFDNQVPNLSAAIDLFLNRDELFILNEDGHMLQCTFSNVSLTPTRCTDPYPYQMAPLNQPAREVVAPSADFERMHMTQPPEPSIYILDTGGPAVYQFSLVLNFVAQLRPDSDSGPLPQTPPTGFVVTRGRNLVLAFGNQLYNAPLPAP
jgi:hypothetical protein